MYIGPQVGTKVTPVFEALVGVDVALRGSDEDKGCQLDGHEIPMCTEIDRYLYSSPG